jgi:SAM-dependent methyltransferase
MPIGQCRSCGANDLHLVLDLGETPVANALLRAEALAESEGRFPLAILFCEACSLLQISETIPPTVIFDRDYPYFSSTSPALVRHAQDNVDGLIVSRRLGPDSFVMEIASNDGYLLKRFVERGIPALGIDPAEGPVAAARAIGVPTLEGFFSRELAEGIARENGRADVVIANNVLAHVPTINDFVAGIALALKPDGVAVFEFPYVINMIDACEFDTIYHEHVFYFSLTALTHLFRRHDLFLNDAVELAVHGGSLRLFVSRRDIQTPTLLRLIEVERERGVDRMNFYRGFAERVESLRRSLAGMLQNLKAEGKRIAAYGAAAKGATLLNFIKLEPGVLEYVVDRNPHKQGKYMPGQRLAIRAPEVLASDRPDYTLLLVWNFAEEVMRDQKAYVEQGGRFIVPIPHPCIVEPSRIGDAEPVSRVGAR